MNRTNGYRMRAIMVGCMLAMAALAPMTACAQQGKDSKTISPDTATRLKKLGFTVYAKPIELPRAKVRALAPDGASLDLSALAGQVTLLNFWATWCPPCRSEIPSIARLESLMKGTSFKIAAISVGEDDDTVRSFIAAAGYAFPVYLDPNGELGRTFASRGIPATYIVDATGRIIAGTVGSREWDDPSLVEALRELSAK